MEEARPVYPFTAIIGQEEMKFAALMNIIDPNIGGIMVMGDRGIPESLLLFDRWYVAFILPLLVFLPTVC